jgi:hypothetical protein
MLSISPHTEIRRAHGGLQLSRGAGRDLSPELMTTLLPPAPDDRHGRDLLLGNRP